MVVDAATQQPIAGAKIVMRGHKYIFCTTAPDGHFDFPANYVWGPCFIIPGDFLPIARLSFEAPGYQTISTNYCGGISDQSGVVLKQPVKLAVELPK